MAGITFAGNQITSPRWCQDGLSHHTLLPGIMLDPAQFAKTDAVIATVGTAGAAKGATSIPVAALSGAIPVGTLLNFGPRAAVVVALSASAIATATSIAFAALTGPIPSGAVLDFGTNKFARTTAAAATGATSVAVAALPTALGGSETATYRALTDRVARVATAPAAAATSIVVDALDEELVSTDVATYAGSATAKATVLSGTPVGRTYTERASGTAFGPAASTDDEVFLVAFDVYDVTVDATASPVRPNARVYENFLPNYTAIAANTALLAKIRALYQTMIGVA